MLAHAREHAAQRRKSDIANRLLRAEYSDAVARTLLTAEFVTRSRTMVCSSVFLDLLRSIACAATADGVLLPTDAEALNTSDLIGAFFD